MKTGIPTRKKTHRHSSPGLMSNKQIHKCDLAVQCRAALCCVQFIIAMCFGRRQMFVYFATSLYYDPTKYLIYNYARNILGVCLKTVSNVEQVGSWCTLYTVPFYNAQAMMFIWLFSCWNPNENSFKCFARSTVQTRCFRWTPRTHFQSSHMHAYKYEAYACHKQNTKWHEILCGTMCSLSFENIWTTWR